MIGAANLAGLMDASMGSASARSVAPNRAAAAKMTPEQIDKTAQDFESMFLGQMLEQMMGDSVGSEAFGDQDSSDVYKGLMMDAYGKEITNAGGIGIAAYVKQELLKLQEG